MRTPSFHNLWIAVLIAIFTRPAITADHETAAERVATDEREVASDERPVQPAFVYQPPNRGAPTQRVGGGTRSITQLSTLIPSHTALTIRTQPRLYWFITPGFRNKVRFRLAEAGVSTSLFEILLPPQPNGGIQYLDLAAHNIRLEPGKSYEWGLMLEPLAHQRLPLLISRARIAVDDAYAPLQNAPARDRPLLAAQQGYWVDAFDWISQLMQADTENRHLRLQRADLLEQGGLLAAAAYERDRLRTR